MKQKVFRFVACVVFSVALAGSVSGQTLADNSEGRFRIAGNEGLFESKIADPSAIRLRVLDLSQGGLGKISWDYGTKEMVLAIGARSPGDGGEFSLNLLKPGGSSTDADMVKVLEVNHEGGFRFKLPVVFEAGTNLGGANGNQFFSYDASSGRLLMFNPQADAAWPLGVIVVYDITNGTPRAIGKIEVKPL